MTNKSLIYFLLMIDAVYVFIIFFWITRAINTIKLGNKIAAHGCTKCGNKSFFKFISYHISIGKDDIEKTVENYSPYFCERCHEPVSPGDYSPTKEARRADADLVGAIVKSSAFEGVSFIIFLTILFAAPIITTFAMIFHF